MIKYGILIFKKNEEKIKNITLQFKKKLNNVPIFYLPFFS